MALSDRGELRGRKLRRPRIAGTDCSIRAEMKLNSLNCPRSQPKSPTALNIRNCGDRLWNSWGNGAEYSKRSPKLCPGTAFRNCTGTAIFRVPIIPLRSARSEELLNRYRSRNCNLQRAKPAKSNSRCDVTSDAWRKVLPIRWDRDGLASFFSKLHM